MHAERVGLMLQKVIHKLLSRLNFHDGSFSNDRLRCTGLVAVTKVQYKARFGSGSTGVGGVQNYS